MFEKEYVTINFNGKQVQINRIWAEHRFSDQEINELASGKTIHITAKSHKGSEFECDGNLQEQEYQGFKFVGFKMLPFEEKEKATGIYTPTGQQISFNREWGGHRFSDQEVASLLAGSEISFKRQNKRGTEYDCVGKLAQKEYEDRSFWGIEANPFDNKERKTADNEANSKPIDPFKNGNNDELVIEGNLDDQDQPDLLF